MSPSAIPAPTFAWLGPTLGGLAIIAALPLAIFIQRSLPEFITKAGASHSLTVEPESAALQTRLLGNRTTSSGRMPAGRSGGNGIAQPSQPIQQLVPVKTSASSFFAYGTERHPPEYAFDGNPATAWNEAHGGSGRGAWVEAQFAEPRHLRSIRISTGYDAVSPKYGDLFVLNRHAKALTVLFDGGSARTVAVAEGERQITLDHLDVVATRLRIVVDDFWSGTKWQDICISEIVVQGDPLSPRP